MTRLSAMHAVRRIRNRAMADAMDTSEDLPATRRARCRVDDLHLAFAEDMEKVRKHAQW